jgi:shikimate dehydrogenase
VTAVPSRRAAVLGHPIAHSLSPVLHRAAYAQLGLDWSYDARDVEESALDEFLAGCGPEWAGLSLTMPLKRAVLPLLDSASALVATVGAANTVVLGPQGRVGHNTDVAGMIEALRGIGAQPGPAVVLGAGATAASAVAALAELGCPQVHVHARRPEAAGDLLAVAGRVGIPVVVSGWPERLPDEEQATIVVSTLPADAGAPLADAVPVRPGALLDASYAPWPPPLVAAWRAAGGRAVAGDEMLLHQAVEQVALMSGRRPQVETMRAALHAELDRRTGAQAAPSE